MKEEIIEDKELIKEEIISFYQNLYTEEKHWRPSTYFERMGCLTTEEKDGLEATVGEEEVLAAVTSCAPDKALGPDGLTMAFYHKNWDTIKNYVLGALNQFHHNCNMVKSFNASFIALVPKRKGAMALMGYRPISLIGSFYKITA